MTIEKNIIIIKIKLRFFIVLGFYNNHIDEMRSKMKVVTQGVLLCIFSQCLFEIVRQRLGS